MNNQDKRQLVQLWDGWVFDGEFIINDKGYKWNRQDLYEAFMSKQLYREFTGYASNILFIKHELQKRIDAMKPPKIVLNWNDQEITINFK